METLPPNSELIVCKMSLKERTIADLVRWKLGIDYSSHSKFRTNVFYCFAAELFISRYLRFTISSVNKQTCPEYLQANVLIKSSGRTGVCGLSENSVNAEFKSKRKTASLLASVGRLEMGIDFYITKYFVKVRGHSWNSFFLRRHIHDSEYLFTELYRVNYD